MGLIGRSIEQTRIWIDPHPDPAPSLNYKEVFPYTTLDAVYDDMNNVPDGVNLRTILEEIKSELSQKQTKIPGKSANYIMTFAGTQGAVGAIQMSREIPWDPNKQSHDKIPTEKAVGELIRKLGLVDANGNVIEDSAAIHWSDIIGRPLLYEDTGNNDDGFMTQKAVSEHLADIRTDLADLYNDTSGKLETAIEAITSHSNNKNNPHNVTVSQIGAVSEEEFNNHLISDTAHIPSQVGLGNVDNTSDMDKPISTAAQKEFDQINTVLKTIQDDDTFIHTIDYSIETGVMTVSYLNGVTKTMNIPINGTCVDIEYDRDTKNLVWTELSGEVHNVSLLDLFTVYEGGTSDNITVLIEPDELKNAGFNYGNTNSTSDGFIELVTKEINNLWNKGEMPANADDDADSPGIGQISTQQTDDMWESSILPDESGTEQITTRISLTNDEIEDLWYNATLPNEEADEYDEVATSDIGYAGYQVITAYINAHSITENEISDGAINTRVLGDESVTTIKIANSAVTTNKLANAAVTNEKIDNYAISNKKIANRVVDGRTLFTSNKSNRVLAVGTNNTDPSWVQVNTDMIENNSITNEKLVTGSVSTAKLQDKSVTTSKLDDSSITNEKISASSITTDKIQNGTILGEDFAKNIVIPGTPSITVRPDTGDNSTKIPDTHWVTQTIDNFVFDTDNYGDRTVTGAKLFTSTTRHRVLGVLRANTDPEWVQVDNDMVANDAISTVNLIDKAVTGSKIANETITDTNLASNSVTTAKIADSNVTLDKIEPHHTANRVIATIADNANPIYTQVNNDMIANNAINAAKVQDQSLYPSKVQPSSTANRVLTTTLANANPSWTQVNNGMIADRAVNGSKLFTTSTPYSILGITTQGTDAVWTKLLADMLGDKAVTNRAIDDNAISNNNMQTDSVSEDNIIDGSVTANKIGERAVEGRHLFTSENPNMILAVTSVPYTNAVWSKVTSEMIDDRAVTREKLFSDPTPYTVIGITEEDGVPEYLKIRNEFIEDDTILPNKLTRDFVLYGTPQLTISPADDADNHQLADTQWVRQTIDSLLKDFDYIYGTVDEKMIKDYNVTGKKLYLNEYKGPRVLGSTNYHEEAEYLLVEGEMIADGGVTENKIQRDVHLLGSPGIELRPNTDASDSTGEGHLIPDCQWVIDRINDAGGNLGTSSSSSATVGTVADEGITTKKLQNRAVTGAKLFTTPTADRVLAVLSSNADPEYTQINHNMLEDRIIEGNNLFTTDTVNSILAVTKANGDSVWTKIVTDMITDKAITTEKINDNSVTNAKIVNKSITREKLANEAMIGNDLLQDNSVSTTKIQDSAVTTAKIADGNVTSEKLASDLVLPGHPTVSSDAGIGTRSLRCVVISPNEPSGGESGDIWFRYV